MPGPGFRALSGVALGPHFRFFVTKCKNAFFFENQRTPGTDPPGKTDSDSGQPTTQSTRLNELRRSRTQLFANSPNKNIFRRVDIDPKHSRSFSIIPNHSQNSKTKIFVFQNICPMVSKRSFLNRSRRAESIPHVFCLKKKLFLGGGVFRGVE